MNGQTSTPQSALIARIDPQENVLHRRTDTIVATVLRDVTVRSVSSDPSVALGRIETRPVAIAALAETAVAAGTASVAGAVRRRVHRPLNLRL